MNSELKEQFVFFVCFFFFSVVLFLFCFCALSFTFWPKKKQDRPTLNDYPLTEFKVEGNEYNFLKFDPSKQHNCIVDGSGIIGSLLFIIPSILFLSYSLFVIQFCSIFIIPLFILLQKFFIPNA